MPTKATLVSLFSFLLFDAYNAQTGAGCYFTTCQEVGQVRMDAIYDANNQFIGGCTCGCAHDLFDPTSPNFCEGTVNWDSTSQKGDCSCSASAAITPKPSMPIYNPHNPQQPQPNPPNYYQPGNVPTMPIYTQPTARPVIATYPTYPRPNWVPTPLPTAPLFTTPTERPVAISNPLPNPNTPAAPVPTYPLFPVPFPTTAQQAQPNPSPTLPAVMYPAYATCDMVGDCACPLGTMGPCYIECSGTDGCKDGIIECNNDNFPCTVDCVGEVACSGSASINGPRNGKLTVNMVGDKAGEGAVNINAELGTGLTVLCEGFSACKGTSFNFGQGLGSIACNGEPDSCLQAIFNLQPNAEMTPGMGFKCTGLFCPSYAPAPFNNVQGPQSSDCTGPGDCSCASGTSDVCVITCDGGADACKDGIIACNSDGFDCTVNCLSEASCSGSAEIVGPVGAKLTVNCIGMKSCEGATKFNGASSTDVSVLCQGNEACKGSVEFNFGNGIASLACNGLPDSCVGGSVFNTGIAAGFSCTGPNCPPEAPTAFGPGTNVQPVRPQTTLPGNFVPSTPGGNTPSTPGGVAPVAPNNPSGPIIAPLPINPVPWTGTPIQPVPWTPGGGAGGGNVVSPSVPAPAPPAANMEYCCRTSIADFLPWRGRCWAYGTEVDCKSEPNGRCSWEPTRCMPSAPTCLMRNVQCSAQNECCSEVCIFDASGTSGKCR